MHIADRIARLLDEMVVARSRLPADVAADRRGLERHRDCGTGHGFCDDGPHGNDRGQPCADFQDLALRYGMTWSGHSQVWRSHTAGTTFRERAIGQVVDG